MMKLYLNLTAMFCCVLLLSACGGGRDKKSGGSDNNTTNNTTNNSANNSQQDKPVKLVKSLQNITLSSGSLLLKEGFGSGAFHAPSDPSNVFYTVTDRGPTIQCRESEQFFGQKDLCKKNSGKIFLIPDYTPTIYKISVQGKKAKILEAIPLNGNDGKPVTGITNPLKSADTEKGYTTDGTRIPFNPSGLDPEDLVRLSNGTFWIADEYAPSLVHIDSTGNVLNRIVPRTIADDLDDAQYPVIAGLPKILRKRVINKGIEALAVSRDETQLYLMLQSPLANPKKTTSDKSKNIRILRFSLSANGDIDSTTGEFVYQLDNTSSFAFENTEPAQQNITITDMAALNDDELLVLERTQDITKIYKVYLASATNILETKYDKKSTSPSLEELDDLRANDIVPVSKEIIYNSLIDTGGSFVAGKIEGMALLDQTHILLMNDNDFGIDKRDSKIQILTTPNNLFE